ARADGGTARDRRSASPGRLHRSGSCRAGPARGCRDVAARQPDSLRRRSAAAAGGDRPEPNLAGFGPFIHGLRPRTRAPGRRADRTDGAALLEPAAARRAAAGTDRIGAVALL